jgi:hypothetical protein
MCGKIPGALFLAFVLCFSFCVPAALFSQSPPSGSGSTEYWKSEAQTWKKKYETLQNEVMRIVPQLEQELTTAKSEVQKAREEVSASKADSQAQTKAWIEQTEALAGLKTLWQNSEESRESLSNLAVESTNRAIAAEEAHWWYFGAGVGVSIGLVALYDLGRAMLLGAVR